MALERVNQISCAGVPYFAGTIVAARNELVPVFVEAAVRERQHMALEFLHQDKLLIFFLVNLFYEFCMRN